MRKANEEVLPEKLGSRSITLLPRGVPGFLLIRSIHIFHSNAEGRCDGLGQDSSCGACS